MLTTTEVLNLERVSQAKKFSALAQDIRDAVVDGWHTPEVIGACATRAVVTQLECAIDPQLLLTLSASEARAGMSGLVLWLKGKQVEYTLAYRVAPAHQSADSKGHRLALKFFWCAHESARQ